MVNMKRVLYKEIKGCSECCKNIESICDNLNRHITNIDFRTDCPLPRLEDVEKYTKYVDESLELEVCGNCKHWSYWLYNPHLKCDVGFCSKVCSVVPCSDSFCDGFDGV